MKTTRQEVEELFGNPRITYSNSGASGNTVEYEIKAGELSVTYSLGKCSGKSDFDYDVEKDTVTSFDIDLKNQIDVSKLKLDLSEFEGSEISDLRGVYTYHSAEFGEYYEISKVKGQSVKVRSLDFSPTISQESLACKNTQTEK